MLPDESDFAAKIKSELANDLYFGDSLLSSCISILTDRHPTALPETGEAVSYRVGHALCFKACKTYRSVLHLSQIGASYDADVLVRTLFETTLATLFVVFRNVALEIPDFPDDELTSDCRARVYLAFGTMQEYRDFLRKRFDPRFGTAIAITEERLRRSSEKAESVIGPFWASRQKRSRTYSGFKLNDLAEKLDPMLSKWYAGIYAHQSLPTHALDAANHVQFDEIDGQMMPRWQSTIYEVKITQYAAGYFLCRCISELHNRFRFAKNQRLDIDTAQELELSWTALGRIASEVYGRLEP